MSREAPSGAAPAGAAPPGAPPPGASPPLPAPLHGAWAELSARAGIVEIVRPASPASPAAPLTGIAYDSRAVKPGGLYAALPGVHTDGHRYIAQALDAGAAAILCEKIPDDCRGRPALFIRVRDARRALSPFAAAFYGHPSRSLAVAGVTGTEGKSTTVYLIYQLLRLLGLPAGFISTVRLGDGVEERWNPEHQTTPEAPVVHRLLREMAGNGARYAVVEASSHGLSRRTSRLADVRFRLAVLTNVTHEHLEFHGTWEQYRDDKAGLFRGLGPDGCAVINADDPSAPYMRAAAAPARVLTYSVKGVRGDPAHGVQADGDPAHGVQADGDPAHGDPAHCVQADGDPAHGDPVHGVQADGDPAHGDPPADLSVVSPVESGPDGNRYTIREAVSGRVFPVEDRLPGAFNAGNVLAALLAVSVLAAPPGAAPLDLARLVPLVPRLTPVRGRMTAVRRGQPFEVLVDYAHTPSSFETIFPPLRRRLSASGGRVIALFGSAGERDTVKRPLQGRVAAAHSDIVILADEDPRGEDPMAILEEIAAGCGAEKTRGETLFLIPDRRAAIRKAFQMARPGDLVLLLGKGHENSIIQADGPRPYDEINEAEAALAELGWTPAGDAPGR